MFDEAYSIVVLNYEGGYSNRPEDRGGETYMGISRRYHPDWEGWRIVDQYKGADFFPLVLDTDGELQEMVREFYKTKFWDRISGDRLAEISEELSISLFDIAVNMGVHRAGEILQRALNLLNRNEQLYDDLKVDGLIGPVTLKALEVFLSVKGDRLLIKLVEIMQGCQYIRIAETDKTQEVNILGWIGRVKIKQKEV